MFKFKTASQRVREVQKKNLKLEDREQQNRADLEFVAAMCDVEIPEGIQEGGEHDRA